MEYDVKKINEHTWMICEGKGESGVYMYLLEGNDKALLIDTGMGSGDLYGVCRQITSKEIIVVLTHGHIDHIGCAYQFDEVYMNPADRELYGLHTSEEVRRSFGVSSTLPKTLNILELKDKECFDLGNREVEVVFTPGHSIGSVCLLDKSYRFLYTGDTCCKAHVLLQMDYAATLGVYLDSLEKIMSRASEFDVTYPAHHSVPVEKEIILEYMEAVQGILDGKYVGNPVKLPYCTCRIFEYKDIGIEYIFV